MLNGSLADLQGYLKTELEVGPPEVVPMTDRNRENEAVNVKITVSNTAPDSNDWPKIVFLGVGLGVANIGEPSEPRLEIIRTKSGLQASHDNGERTGVYTRTQGEAFQEIIAAEERFGDVLIPGQSITYEMEIPPQDMPYTEFRVEGTISRRHLLHYEHILTPPDSYTRPPLISALRAFNAIELHNLLDSAMQSMPDLGPDTRLVDLQAFTTILSNGIPEIKAVQSAVNDVYREAPNQPIRAHMKAAYQYLTNVSAALVQMKEATSSTNSEEISAASEVIKLLESEAAQINKTTEELMLRYGVSDEETGYRYRGR